MKFVPHGPACDCGCNFRFSDPELPSYITRKRPVVEDEPELLPVELVKFAKPRRTDADGPHRRRAARLAGMSDGERAAERFTSYLSLVAREVSLACDVFFESRGMPRYTLKGTRKP